MPYRERLLPRVLPEYATLEPGEFYALVSHLYTDPRQGFHDLTPKSMAHCVELPARQLEDIDGRSSTFETVCYLGKSDLCGAMMFLPAAKYGYRARVYYQ